MFLPYAWDPTLPEPGFMAHCKSVVSCILYYSTTLTAKMTQNIFNRMLKLSAMNIRYQN